MKSFLEFLEERKELGGFSTEDIVASFVPLVRQTIQTHGLGQVAPLEGVEQIQVDRNRLWFEQAKALLPRLQLSRLADVEAATQVRVKILSEKRRITDVSDGREEFEHLEIGVRGEPITRPVYLPGYISWEQALEHHDPLTDIFNLGMLLASMACGLNFCDPAQLTRFVENRRNLFELNPNLHPVIATVLVQMTELDRHRRAQDLAAIVHLLENYRHQSVEFDTDLVRVPGFHTRDVKTKQQVVLSKLRDRLFDLSRRNPLLHFRATSQSINLTHASVPLLFDIRNIAEDKILVWNETLQQHIVDDRPIPLNKFLNFAEALYLPSQLDRLLSESRRDQNEYGFAQLRLVACFLSWANLKETPAELYVSPLVLIPVRLVKSKGIRDTYSLDPLSSEAEINPVVRHLFRQLYAIELPESIDLAKTDLRALFDGLVARVQSSEPAVTIEWVDRPQIDLVHEKAKRRLDQYRRSARLSGRGVRTLMDLDYSYDPANFHPLGIKLFLAKVRPPTSTLRTLLEETPRPRSFIVPESSPSVVETEKTLFALRQMGEQNPYLWTFDLCNVTLANLRYRKMSLVRDYEALLEQPRESRPFDATFSLVPRDVDRTPPPVEPLANRFEVVPADPTQSRAIAEARRGSSYIIQGPPGTGKSQTITNLIADFVAQGKRVLFVCEKRAAIDVVYARLRQCGLDPLCCLIHDSQTDKKQFVMDLKQTYETWLADEKSQSSKSRRAREKLLREFDEQMQPLEQFEQVMEEELASTELPVRNLLERCVELRPRRPDLAPETEERVPDYGTWWTHRGQIEGFQTRLSDLQSDGVLHRFAFRSLHPQLASDERPVERVTAGVRQSLSLLQQFDQLRAASGISIDEWNTIERVDTLIMYCQNVQQLGAIDNLSLLDPLSERSKALNDSLAQVDVQEAVVAELRGQNIHWRSKLPPMDLATAKELAKSYERNVFAWLSPSWWRLRSVLRRSYDFGAHAITPSWTQVLGSLEREYAAVAELQRRVAATQERFQFRGDADSSRRHLSSFRAEYVRYPAWLQRIHASLLQAPDAERLVQNILAMRATFEQLRQELGSLLVGYESLSFDELQELLHEMTGQLRHLPKAMPLLADLSRLPQEVGTCLRELPMTVPEIEAASAHRTWESVCIGNRAIMQFTHKAREGSIAKLENLYDGWLKSNATEICNRVRDRFLEHIHLSNQPAAQTSAEERNFKKSYSQGRRDLEHEFGKQMRYRSIRDLVSNESGDVIRDLKPIWLMSPLSVSDTLPLDTGFVDVVIFDEASQVPLEDSVPTIFRGEQVIVVGDEKQLPPTDFFSTKDDELDEEIVVVERNEAHRYDLASDSLLNHAAKNLASTMLGWHYRSRSESLISFSNWGFYDGRLLTVPDHRLPEAANATSTESAALTAEVGAAKLLSRPLSFHHLPHAVYERRVNRVEAEYIAGLVRSLLINRSGLSIGVIAFSEAQQTEIESALNRLAQDDDAFRELLDIEREREVDGQFVGLLVKNLENIQGDERDLVILSICYGPGPDGKMLMNFGPINKSGGEKRLNVAFSRAKQYMAVVSTIQFHQITNEYNEGANYLRNYLRYAEFMSAGDAASASRVLASLTRWRAEGEQPRASLDATTAEIIQELQKRGYVAEPNVGHSHFRVDIAVRRPGESEHRLGILVDSPASYEQTDLLERMMLRPRLLRNFGWNILSVLAKDWYADPAAELDRIEAMLARS